MPLAVAALVVDDVDPVPDAVPLAVALEDHAVDRKCPLIGESPDCRPAAAIVGAQKGGRIGAAVVVHPHDAGGHCKEVLPVLPLDAPDFDEAKIGFVDEGRRLKSVSLAFAAHVLTCESPQFFDRVTAVREALHGTPAARETGPVDAQPAGRIPGPVERS